MTNKELKAIRKQLEMTTKELAEVLDVSQRTYYGWESGRPMPRIAVRAITMLLWMDKAARETFLKFVKENDNGAITDT